MIVQEPGRVLIRCDGCGLTVEARATWEGYRPPVAWAREHRPGYSEGADEHLCPACRGRSAVAEFRFVARERGRRAS